MKERLEGFEYKRNDGKTIVMIPLTSYDNVSYDEVHNQLKKDGDEVITEPVQCIQAYQVKGSCGLYSGKVVFVRHEFTGEVTRGYKDYITKIHDIIRNINCVKRHGVWKGSL